MSQPPNKPFAVRLVAALTANCLIGANLVWASGQIVIDGRTQTRLAVQGSVTDVTTATVHGANAFNSFQRFDVHQGNTVNLHLPDAAANLINLVHGKTSQIDGVLNAYRRGEIGGNVYFANPHGLVVGAGGVVNVGALAVTTPTQSFMDRFFDASGNPSAEATRQLLEGTAPLDPDAAVEIRGTVNARGDIRVQSGHVLIAGGLNSQPLPAAGNSLADPLNTDGLVQGAALVERNGEIWLLAENDIAVTGTLVADGAEGLDAGGVTVRAGRDIGLAGDARLSARGRGTESDGGRVVVLAEREAVISDSATLDAGSDLGDGGFAEFSARESLVLAGGLLLADAPFGTSGSVLIDPENLTIATDLLRNQAPGSGEGLSWDAGSLTLEATQKITVAEGVVISTRVVTPGPGQTAREAHLSNASTGASGDLTLTARQIELKSGAELRADADAGHAAGDVTLNAKDDLSTPVFGSVEDQVARIDVTGATIKGDNVRLTATADDKYDYDGKSATRVFAFLENLSTPIDITSSSADARIILDGGAVIVADGDVHLDSQANADARMRAIFTGLAFGWGEAEATAHTQVLDATIDAGGRIDLTSDAASTIVMTVAAANAGSTNPLPASANKYVDLAGAVAKGRIDSRAVVGSDATVSAAGNAVTLRASGTKRQNVTAFGKAYDDGTAGAAVGVTFFDSDVIAELAGRVDAATVNVDANLKTPKNSTNVVSGAGSGLVGGAVKTIDPRVAGASLLSRLSSFVSTTTVSPRARNTATQLGLSAAFAWVEHSNDVTARVDGSGHVTATGPVAITARAQDDLSYHAASAVDQAKIQAPTISGTSTQAKKVALSASVAVVDLVNHAWAGIDDGAAVASMGDISVIATSDIPPPWQAWVDLFEAAKTSFQDVDDTESFFVGLYDLLKDGAVQDAVLDSTFSLATGWTQSFAESESFSFAGSVNILDLDNRATAAIGDGALINQEPAMPDHGNVSVLAEAAQDTINLSGIFGFNPKKAFTGTQTGSAGFGGAYLEMDFNGGADASIGQGALVNADDLAVVALTEFNNISIGESGGTAGKVGINGVFSLTRMNTETVAQIAPGGTIVADNVLIAARDDSQNINAAGGIAKGGNVGIGFSISINEAERDTYALLGDAPADLRANPHVMPGSGGSLTTTGNLLLDATALGRVGSYSLAGAVKGAPENNPGDGEAKSSKGGKGGKGGIGLSGDVSWNEIRDTTQAVASSGLSLDIGGGPAHTVHLGDASDQGWRALDWSGTLADPAAEYQVARGLGLAALNATDMQAFSGAVTIGQGSFGLAGSVGFNDIAKLTHASVRDVSLNANDLVDISAVNSGKLFAINASGSGSLQKNGIQVAGQYAQNNIRNEAFAAIEDSSVSVSDDDGATVDQVRINAEDDSAIWAIAGAVTLGGKAGIGVSVSDNTVANKTHAYIKDSRVDAGEQLHLDAKSDNDIRSLAATFSVSTALAGTGSGADNDILNETKAYVDNSTAPDRTLAARDETSLQARDESLIETLSGGVSLSQQASLGVSVSVNRVANTTEAYLDDVVQNENGNQTRISAENLATIRSLSGAVGGALTAVGAGGAAAVNRIANTTRAYVTGSASDLAVESLVVDASAESDIETISVAAGVAKVVGVGGSVTTNFMDSTVDAHIDGGAKVVAQHNVGVLAENDERIQVAAGSAGVAVKAAGVGVSISVNDIDSDTLAYIDGPGTRVTGLARGGETLEINSGGLQADVALAEQVDLATYGRLDLKAGKAKESVAGVAVVASSSQHIESIAANVAGGAVGAGLVENIDTIGGLTEASVNNAALNQDNAGADPVQSVRVVAGNVAYANSFVGNIAAGGVAAGIGTDLHGISRTTRSAVRGGLISARGAVDINAIALQGVSSVVTGGSIGGTGATGSLSMVLFRNSTESLIDGSAVAAGSLEVSADNDNELYVLGGSLAGGSNAYGGTFVVAKSDSTTRASIENTRGSQRLDVSGDVTVEADSQTDIDQIAISGALAGGLGIAGMAAVNLVTDTTEASVGQAELGTDSDRAASLTVAANHAVDINAMAGTLATGVAVGGSGFGAGASVNVVKARTLAAVTESSLHTSGSTSVSAASDKIVENLTLTAGIGQTAGIGGAAAVTLIGDTVKDEAAAEVDTGTLSAVDDFANNERLLDLAADDEILTDAERQRVNDDTRTGVRDVATGSGASAYQFRTAAAVEDSQIRAGSLDVNAVDRTGTLSTVGGFGIALGLGAGAGVGVTKVKANVYAGVDDGGSIDTVGDVAVSATAEDKGFASRLDNQARNKSIEILALNGSAGLVGLGAAVAIGEIDNNITAELGGSVNAGSGQVAVTAMDRSEIEINGYGGAVGAVGAGAVVARAAKTSQVDARSLAGTQLSAGGAEIRAGSSGRLKAFTLGAAGGLYAAGVGADAQVTEATLVQAATGVDNSFTLTGGLVLDASVAPDAQAESRGYGGAGLGYVGVAIANALVSNAAVAEVGDRTTIDAAGLSLSAEQTRNGSTTARARSIAAGGALLGSVNATQSEARNTGVVQATVGDDADIAVTGDVALSARSDSRQTAEVDAYNGALGAAAGSNIATATYLTGQYAGLGQGVDLAADNLTIDVVAGDENFADSLSGQGALLASVAAAQVTTSGISNTTAFIGNGRDGSRIDVNRLALSAEHVARFNGKANTYNGALLGMSGANIDNRVNSNLEIVLGTADASGVVRGEGLAIETGDLSIAARNLTRKPNLGAENALSGSGGFYDGPAVRSNSTITHDTGILLGSGTKLAVTGDPAAPGRFEIAALNDVQAYDKVKLDSGGAIANAKGVSRVVVDRADATISVGDSAELRSVGDMHLGARTVADLQTNSYVNTYGLSGSGQGTTRSEINAANAVSVGAGALLRSEGDLVLGAGNDAIDANQITASARTELFNKTAVPFNTDPEAHAGIDQRNTITVAPGAEALAIGDVYLLATSGSHSTSGKGTGTDLYREGGEEVVNFFGGLVGADEVSFDIQGGSTSDLSVAGVRIDGEVRAGIQHNQFLTIAEDGSVALDGDGNPFQSDGVEFTVAPGVSLNDALADRIEELEALAAEYADVPDIAQAFQTEADFLKLKLADLGGEQVNVDFINVADVFARSGDVSITGDYLAGDGLIEAPGDTRIRIWNQSESFLSVNDLTIAEDQGGKVLYNGVPVHDNADIASKNIAQYLADVSLLFSGAGVPQPNLTVIDAVNSALPEVSVLSTNVRADPLAGVFLDGDINNRRGNVSIYSEGDVTASGNIDAYSVDIKAGRDVLLGFVWGFRHLGGDPTTHAPFDTLARQSENPNRFPSTPFDRTVDPAVEVLPPGTQGILAGGNILISAERVNVNNTIEAGRPYRTITIGDAMTAGLPGLQAAYDNGSLAGTSAQAQGRIVGDRRYAMNFQPGTEDSLPADFVRAWYNLETQRIELEPLRVEGGKVVLYGDIFSTGNGTIRAVDGYGRINVVNTTAYPLEIARMDTGGGDAGIEGRIQITDTAIRSFDPSSGQFKPTTTVYTRLGDEISREVSYLDDNGNPVLLASGPDAGAADGRNTLYQPREDRHFHWVNGETTRTDEERIYTTRVLFGLDWLVPDYDNPDSRSSTSHYTSRITGDYLADSRPAARDKDYYFDYTVYNGNWFKWKDDTEQRRGVVCVAGGCAYQEVTVTAYFRKYTNEYYNHAIAADKPIDIRFTGWDEGELNLVSQGPVYLTDKVRNLKGQTSINAMAGIFQDTDAAVIEAKNLTLRAAGAGILGSGNRAVDVDLSGSVLNLYAMNDIVVHEENGDLTIGEVVSSAGAVRLSADLGIATATGADAPASGVNVSAAKDIVLESRYGAIGNGVDDPIVIDSNAAGGFTVSAEAAEDIHLREHSGDLRVDTIRSLGGDVSVRLPGTLLDANGDEQRDLAAERVLLESVANELGLLDANAIAQREAAAVAAFESSVEQVYETYWREERGLTPDGSGGYDADPYDPDVTFAFGTAEASALAAAGWSVAQIAEYEAERTARYRAFGQQDYDPDFNYTIDPAERLALLEGAGWTADEIANRLPRSLFAKEVSDTETRIESANLQGRSLLIVAGAEVGASRGDVVIAAGTRVEDLDDDQRLALAAAERDDLVFESDRVVINQKEDFDVALLPGGSLTLSATGAVYLGSESDLNIRSLTGETIRVKSAGGIYNAEVGGSSPTIAGRSAVLESADRGLGLAASPLRLDLADAGRLTARAGGDLFLQELSGNMDIDFVYSTGLASLSAPGSILDAAIDFDTDIRARSVSLETAEHVGLHFLPEGFVDITHNPDGSLILDVAGDAAVFSPSQSLRLAGSAIGGDLSAVASLADVVLLDRVEVGGNASLAAAESVFATGTQGGADIAAQALELIAAAGAVGQESRWLVGESNGEVTLEGLQGIYYRELDGDLFSNRVVSRQGSVGVETVNGDASFGLVQAAGKASLIAGGNRLGADRVEAAEVDLEVAGEGGLVEIGHVVVTDSLGVRADVIQLPRVEHSGTGQLRVRVSGNDGGLADSMTMHIDSSGSVNYDSLRLGAFDLDFASDNVVLENLLVGTVAWIRTPLHRIVIDNQTRERHPGASAQLYSPGEPFDLKLVPQRLFFTDANVIDYDPDYVVNSFSTENSVVRLQPKRGHLAGVTTASLLTEGSVVQSVALTDIMAEIMATAVSGLVKYSDADDEELLGLGAADAARSASDLVVAD